MTVAANQSKLDIKNNNDIKLSIHGFNKDGSDRSYTTWGSSTSSFKSNSNSPPTTSQIKNLINMTVNPDEFDNSKPLNPHAQSPGHSEQVVSQSSDGLGSTRASWSSNPHRNSITSVSTLPASNATNSLLEGADEIEDDIDPVPLAIVRTQFGIPASRKSSSSDTKTERHADGSTTTIVNADESLNSQGFRSSFPSRPKEIKPINPDPVEPEQELKDLVFSKAADSTFGRNELENSCSSIPHSVGSAGSSGKQAGTQSDDSYSFGLDASWCSTSLSINARALEADKMSNLEDIINGSTRSSDYGHDAAAPVLSSRLPNRKSSWGGNSGITNSFRSVGSESFHLTESEHNLNLDITPSPRQKDALPRLFKTGSARGAKHLSGIPRPVVFVDGGGSDDSADGADVPSSARRMLMGFKRRGSDTTQGSTGRGGNAGLNNSITLTGLQVLTASMQAASRRPSSPDPHRDEEVKHQNGDQHSCSTIDDNHEFDEGNRMNSFNEGGINPSGEGVTVSQADDTELVAAAGGKAYLHASRSVWAMRIIVVATFLVVSVIVTTMTFVFFKTMENELIEAEFAQYSSSMAVSTVQILEKQALSLSGLGNMYTSIFGSEEVPPYNHPSSVILNTDGTMSEDDSKWTTSFPNVTIPGYNEIAANLIGIAELRSATFAPLLMYSEIKAWEEYARNHALPRATEVVQKGIRKATLGLSTTTPSYSVPAWQVAPAEVMTDGIMWDFYSHEPYRQSIDHIVTKYQKPGNFASTGHLPCDAALIPVHELSSTKGADDNDTRSSKSSGNLANTKGWSLPANMDDSCTAIFVPVYDVFPTATSDNANLSGFVTGIFSWTDILAVGGKRFVSDLRVVIRTEFLLSDGTYQSYAVTYKVNEDAATLLGTDVIVDPEHLDMVETFTFSFPGDTTIYSFDIHSTDELVTHYGVSNKPVQLSVVAACFFILSTLVFFIYDYYVKYRQKIIERSAAHTTRIVHSLYPAFIRDSLFENAQNERKRNDGPVHAPSKSSFELKNYEDDDISNRGKGNNSRQASYRTKSLKMKVSDFVDTPTTQLRRFLNHPAPSREYDYNLNTPIIELDPIAEVFERTTVMFADIAGFTAWCSEREPSQVFRLLETVYREFDIEASKLGVFKVETVGDCYVAVTGLPDEREDHAITIAKYAVKCMLKFNVLTKSLEANLGPGTASLGMRFGLHSGPVTAGVLRGEKSRFQLFGDTMNVASRMESTGEKNRIQVSQDTADLIITAGKGHWLTPRESPISAKGKGSIQTYWLKPGKKRRNSSVSYNGRRSETSAMSEESELNVPKSSFHHALQQSWKCIGIENNSRLVAKERLVRWNAAILESFLLKIVDNRNNFYPGSSLSNFTPSQEDKVLSFSEKLSESIMFPDMKYPENYCKVSSSMAISSVARAELIEYVARISSLYRDVPFHNFEHASHVTMSANKLLNKVCSSFVNEEEVSSTGYAVVTERTFGISADPLAQFVVVFSSLVHDVDHQGVPNAQLVKEEDPLAAQFQNRSVAEKRSITIAWDILMEDRYRELQSAIFVNGNEMVRFKQLLINTVLATDIADKERSAAGKIRWQKAFHPSKNPSGDNLDSSGNELDDVSLRSLKATLVFEQIMQASDVAHTMQHWETFRKWNRRLFQELSKAYKEGRGAIDPKEKWYENEIGFFDFYIIPLAKKLRECGVFGTAEREYLDYALENRRRWEEEGRDIAKDMIIEYEAATAATTLSTATGATGATGTTGTSGTTGTTGETGETES